LALKPKTGSKFHEASILETTRTTTYTQAGNERFHDSQVSLSDSFDVMKGPRNAMTCGLATTRDW